MYPELADDASAGWFYDKLIFVRVCVLRKGEFLRNAVAKHKNVIYSECVPTKVASPATTTARCAECTDRDRDGDKVIALETETEGPAPSLTGCENMI